MESNKLDLSDKQLDEDTQHVEDATHKDVTFVSTLDSIESTKADYYIWLVAITVGVGGFLFGMCMLSSTLSPQLRHQTGYDTGIISAVLVVLDNDLGHVLVSSEKELITSITSGGAFLGALAAGFSADKFERKLAIDMGCVVFVIGAVIQACSYSIAQMTVGRFVIGVGVGSAAMIIPVCIDNNLSDINLTLWIAIHRGSLTGQVSRPYDRP